MSNVDKWFDDTGEECNLPTRVGKDQRMMLWYFWRLSFPQNLMLVTGVEVEPNYDKIIPASSVLPVNSEG